MSSVTKQNSISLSSEEAFLAIIVLAIQADGIFELEEKEVVRFAVQRLNIFEGYSQKELIEQMETALKAIQEKGEEGVLANAVASLPQGLNNTVFTVATDIISSNGKMTQHEIDILNKIQQALSIPQDTADKIIEVMKYKNYNIE